MIVHRIQIKEKEKMIIKNMNNYPKTLFKLARLKPKWKKEHLEIT